MLLLAHLTKHSYNCQFTALDWGKREVTSICGRKQGLTEVSVGPLTSCSHYSLTPYSRYYSALLADFSLPFHLSSMKQTPCHDTGSQQQRPGVLTLGYAVRLYNSLTSHPTRMYSRHPVLPQHLHIFESLSL